MSEQLLSGWGRSVWSRSNVHRPAHTAEVGSAVLAGPDPCIARGLGRSYADQATSAGGSVIDMTDLSEIGAVDSTGRVRVHAGTSLNTLLRELVPLGWFVPVSPGTRHVTVGGAIAADIHGKNHHVDGTFSAHVDQLTLMVADGTAVTCGPSDNPELFWATAGGMGLTGVVTEAVIRMQPIETSHLLVDTTRFDSLDDLTDAMVVADRAAPFSVAWVDLMSDKRSARSVLTTARFATLNDLSPRLKDNPLAYSPTERLRTPGWIPNGLLRTSTVRAFNEAWFRMAPKRRSDQLQTITRYFHPLDGVDGWNRMYGSHGFVQWQMVVPDGAEDTLRHCVESLAASSAPCFLAVLKRFGAANPGPLSFPLAGWTLAADMPAQHQGLPELLDRLDLAVADAGGRIYLAKDGRLKPELLETMYPRLDEWRAVRDSVDPERRFGSDLSRRLGL